MERGRVVECRVGLRWRVFFPDREDCKVSGFLRDLAASDCSPATLRSYAFDLLRWLRFLDGRATAWDRAGRIDVREFVESLRETVRPRASLDSSSPVVGYASRTINHQLSVLFSFYEWACADPDGPLVNPVPAQRSRAGGRVHAHQNPMEDFVIRRRATYRQRVPRPTWRGLPDDAADALFDALRSHRDRALVSFWLSSGVRASELLGVRHGVDLDPGGHTITVVSKGSRLRETVPASIDSFVWLALYLREERPPVVEGGPVWWTRQGTDRRPLTYHGARAVLQRANKALGTSWRLHDLRHTAAARMLADPAFTLFDVQAILRHASVSTTQIYAQPRLEDLVGKVLEHYARPAAAPAVEPSYDEAAVRELLGLDR